MTYTLFLVLIMIVAFLLILIIMVQNPKGGGLSSSFGGGGTQSLGGVQNTTNFLDKSTWTLSLVLLALILLSNFVAPKVNAVDTSSEIENTIENREVQDVQTQPATTQKDTAQ
jgi:preprotein translocase subunit SecG